MQQQTKFSLLNECFLHYFTVCMTVSILVFPSACVKGTCVELCSLFLFLRPCLHLMSFGRLDHMWLTLNTGSVSTTIVKDD